MRADISWECNEQLMFANPLVFTVFWTINVFSALIPEILNVLKEDLATMFNTEVQPYTKENIRLGRKLCKQIVYSISYGKDETKVTRK